MFHFILKPRHLSITGPNRPEKLKNQTFDLGHIQKIWLKIHNQSHNRAEKYSGTVTGFTVTVRKIIHKVQDWIRNRTKKDS